MPGNLLNNYSTLRHSRVNDNWVWWSLMFLWGVSVEFQREHIYKCVLQNDLWQKQASVTPVLPQMAWMPLVHVYIYTIPFIWLRYRGTAPLPLPCGYVHLTSSLLPETTISPCCSFIPRFCPVPMAVKLVSSKAMKRQKKKKNIQRHTSLVSIQYDTRLL